MEIKIKDIDKELKISIELLKEEFNERTSSKAIKGAINTFFILKSRYNKVLAEYSTLLKDYKYLKENINEIKK